MLKVVPDGTVANDNAAASCASLLDEIVRDGARRMLAAALQAEVAVYIEWFAHERDEQGRRLVVRNGLAATPSTAPRPSAEKGFASRKRTRRPHGAELGKRSDPGHAARLWRGLNRPES